MSSFHRAAKNTTNADPGELGFKNFRHGKGTHRNEAVAIFVIQAERSLDLIITAAATEYGQAAC